MKCPDCNGKGSVELLISAVTCSTCNGWGVLRSLVEAALEYDGVATQGPSLSDPWAVLVDRVDTDWTGAPRSPSGRLDMLEMMLAEKIITVEQAQDLLVSRVPAPPVPRSTFEEGARVASRYEPECQGTVTVPYRCGAVLVRWDHSSDYQSCADPRDLVRGEAT